MKKLPPLNALRAFEAAARHKSFTAAASDLFVTHGAVSRQIAEGDIIIIDAIEGVLDLEVDDATLEARRKKWTAPSNDFQSGALWRYAQTVGPASKGAVTHPGAKSETHTYADI